MPELPEVETTRRGIAPHVLGRRLLDWQVREARLRWPVELPGQLHGARVERLTRRGKYLLFETERGVLVLHLGMSGSLRVEGVEQPPLPHDHIDLLFSDGVLLRFHDPRRFGSLHFHDGPWPDFWLLADLGPEPLSAAFDGDYLFRRSRRRRIAVKNFIMDSRIVVGVGNIYASEALFRAGIRPGIAAGRVPRKAYAALAAAIKSTLAAAIELGGTTLRDFVGGDGRPGYFKQTLCVYGREGQPCRICSTPLIGTRIGQRASVYCRHCQR